jgi:hypothetical protein
MWSHGVILHSRKQMALKSKVKVNMLKFNLSDKVEIWDLLTGSMSLVEVGWSCGKNESSIPSPALNSVYLKHAWLFLTGGLLETNTHDTKSPWMPKEKLLTQRINKVLWKHSGLNNLRHERQKGSESKIEVTRKAQIYSVLYYQAPSWLMPK